MASSFYHSPQDGQEQIAHAGRIPKTAFKGATIALFVIAIVTATARTAIRVTQQRRLYADDGFLFAAVLFLIASMALLWHALDEIFVAEALVTNPGSAFSSLTGNWIASLFQFLKMSDAFLVLSWTSVLAVKFSFLFFFRNLIDRVRGMKVYWWIVTGVTFAVWAFGCGAVFAPCPYFDVRSLSCSQGPEYGIAVAYSAAIIALDILTDILILVIPIRLIAQIQIKLRQKFALGASLCLSIVIIIISVTCIAGIRAPASSEAIDVSWELFWEAAEACVAVTMVSLVAFRSFFVAQASRQQKSPPRPPQSSPRTPASAARRKALWRKKLRDVSEETTDVSETTAASERRPLSPLPAAARFFRLPGFRALPDIPSARLSGVLTRFRSTREGPPLRADADLMRSRASWDDDLEKGSLDAATVDAGPVARRDWFETDREKREVAELSARPGTLGAGERPGTAVSSQGTTLGDEDEGWAESRPESKWALPIQLPEDRWPER